MRGANRGAGAEGEARGALGAVRAGALARSWLLAALELGFVCHDCGERLARGRTGGRSDTNDKPKAVADRQPQCHLCTCRSCRSSAVSPTSAVPGRLVCPAQSEKCCWPSFASAPQKKKLGHGHGFCTLPQVTLEVPCASKLKVVLARPLRSSSAGGRRFRASGPHQEVQALLDACLLLPQTYQLDQNGKTAGGHEPCSVLLGLRLGLAAMGLPHPQAWLLGLPTAVVYGSLALFTSILHNVFLLYYVDTFVSVYKINKVAFWVGETVFLLWNSLNDPLFGWLSDRKFLSSQPGSGTGLSSRAVVLARVRALGWHGPLLALSFLAFWVHWAPAGLQFLLCLCLYDGFLTLVDLHHHALLADLALSAHDRTHLNFYCSLFSAAGSLSVFASYPFWNKEDFSSFRAFCVALAAGSGLGFLGATRLLRRRVEVARREPGCSALAVDGGQCEEELLVGAEEAGSITLGQYLRQLARHQNFLWFVGMDLVQVFHCHFNSNFFPLFLEHLLSDQISLSTGSFLLGISYVAPHLNNLYFLPLCRRWGVYAVVRGLFLLKLGLSLLMLAAGPDHPGLLCFFIASNRVFTEGTCKLLTLVVTDLVDEDLVLNHRKQAASALLFGMVALVTKPGQTFAPLLGTWLLCFYTGHDLFQQPPMTPVGSAHPWPEPPAPAPARAPALRQGCFYLLVLVPITCALLQLLTWSQFTLHGRRLHMVKAQRQNLAQAQSLDVKTV